MQPASRKAAPPRRKSINSVSHDRPGFAPGLRVSVRKSCENKTSFMRSCRCLLALSTLLAFLVLTGCGYHTLGAATQLPPEVHTISVRFLENKTQHYHTEVEMTEALVSELNTRTRYHVVPAKDAGEADATLSGLILTETITPYTYNSNTGQTSTYMITLSANITLTDRNHRVLYQHTNYQFHQQYEATSDLASFIQEDSPAEKRIARDFARTLVSDILESF